MFHVGLNLTVSGNGAAVVLVAFDGRPEALGMAVLGR